jgi:hypothetical protein
MKSLRELDVSHRRHAFLGGLTLAECAEKYRKAQETARAENPPPPPAPIDELDLPLHLARSGVPDHMASVLVGGPEDTGPVRAVREWMETTAGFLVLHGPSGAGKSLAAATIFLAARDDIKLADGTVIKRYDSRECAFVEASMLSRESYFDQEARDFIAICKRRRLLVLDDLGAEVASGPYLSTLDEIITARFEDKRLRTVLTSNVSAARPDRETPSPFEVRYGARIARRIRDSGKVVAVEPRRMP